MHDRITVNKRERERKKKGKVRACFPPLAPTSQYSEVPTSRVSHVNFSHRAVRARKWRRVSPTRAVSWGKGMELPALGPFSSTALICHCLSPLQDGLQIRYLFSSLTPVGGARPSKVLITLAPRRWGQAGIMAHLLDEKNT